MGVFSHNKSDNINLWCSCGIGTLYSVHEEIQSTDAVRHVLGDCAILTFLHHIDEFLILTSSECTWSPLH